MSNDSPQDKKGATAGGPGSFASLYQRLQEKEKNVNNGIPDQITTNVSLSQSSEKISPERSTDRAPLSSDVQYGGRSDRAPLSSDVQYGGRSDRAPLSSSNSSCSNSFSLKNNNICHDDGGRSDRPPLSPDAQYGGRSDRPPLSADVQSGAPSATFHVSNQEIPVLNEKQACVFQLLLKMAFDFGLIECITLRDIEKAFSELYPHEKADLRWMRRCIDDLAAHGLIAKKIVRERFRQGLEIRVLEKEYNIKSTQKLDIQHLAQCLDLSQWKGIKKEQLLPYVKTYGIERVQDLLDMVHADCEEKARTKWPVMNRPLYLLAALKKGEYIPPAGFRTRRELAAESEKKEELQKRNMEALAEKAGEEIKAKEYFDSLPDAIQQQVRTLAESRIQKTGLQPGSAAYRFALEGELMDRAIEIYEQQRPPD